MTTGSGKNFGFEKDLLPPGECLYSDRLILRRVVPGDARPRYLSWLEDEAVTRFLETRWHPQSIDTITEFVRSMLGDPLNYLMAVIEKEGENHMGNIKLGPINPMHRHADISYFIGERSCWGRGYVSEAIERTVDFGFETLGLNRIQAGVYESNLAGIRVLEKCGFTFEGRFRRQLKLGERWEDHLWYGILHPDYDRNDPHEE